MTPSTTLPTTADAAAPRLASGKAPLLLFASSSVYGRKRSGDEVVDLSHALARVLIEVAQRHGVPKAVHLALPEYYASRAELLSEFEVDDDTPIVFFSLRAPEDHRYLKGADAGYYIDFVGDYVGSHALGASLPQANVTLDTLLPTLARHCPQAPQWPLGADGGRPSVKHQMVLSKLRLRQQQQHADGLRTRNLIVLYPDLDELDRLGFVLELGRHRMDVAVNLLVVHDPDDGLEDPVGERIHQLAERHSGLAVLHAVEVELPLLRGLQALEYELFSSGYRARRPFEQCIADLIGLGVEIGRAHV